MKIKIKNDGSAKFYTYNGALYPITDGEVEIPDEKPTATKEKEAEKEVKSKKEKE